MFKTKQLFAAALIHWAPLVPLAAEAWWGFRSAEDPGITAGVVVVGGGPWGGPWGGYPGYGYGYPGYGYGYVQVTGMDTLFRLSGLWISAICLSIFTAPSAIHR